MNRYLLLCLGNPGAEYEKTRHNIGFRVGEGFCESHTISSKKNQGQSILYSGFIGAASCLVAFPTTYMNESGRAARALVDYFDIPLDHVMVVYDDFDIPFGSIRLRGQGSAGTHNGMKSVVQHLGTTHFPRCRVGIGPRSERQTIHDFVLSPFSKSEEAQIPDILILGTQLLSIWIQEGLTKAMNSKTSLQLPETQ